MSQTKPTKADTSAVAKALLQSAQQVHRIAIDPADEAEVLANLELAARMLQQLDWVELSDDHIDLAPTFLPNSPERS